MWLTPIIQRELRAESRRRLNYYLRLGSAAWSMLWLSALLSGTTLIPNQGSQVFASLALGMFVALWLLAPVMTSDSLSQERREGTLPILFLAPLSPMDIVLAKGTVHMIRALTVWIVALPVLIIPAMLGGVTWMDALRAFLIQAAAILTGMGCGLLASSWCRTWWMSLGVALLLSCGLATGAAVGHGFCRYLEASSLAGQPMNWTAAQDFLSAYLDQRLLKLPFWETHSKYFTDNANFGNWGGTSTPADQTSLMLAALMFLVALFFAFGAVRLAAAVLRRETFVQGPGAWARSWLRLAAEARYGIEGFKNRRERALAINPLAWLGRHSWRWRLTRLCLCLIFCLAEAILLNLTEWQVALKGQYLLHLVLTFTAAAAANSGFRLEIQSGILELLLISPLQPWRIVSGRFASLIRLIGPAWLILAVCWARQLPGVEMGSFSFNDIDVMEYLFSMLSLGLVAVLGVLFSFQVMNPVLGMVGTLGFGFGIPAGCQWAATHWLLGSGFQAHGGLLLFLAVIFHAVVVAVALRNVVSRLQEHHLALTPHAG